jgi:hypothetical protein
MLPQGSSESKMTSGLELQDVDPWDEEELVMEEENFTRDASVKEERWKWWRVYALHFLFVWNTRTYEYASVGASCDDYWDSANEIDYSGFVGISA